jgi:hypothetical protein
MWGMVVFNTIMLEAPFGLTTLQIARISITCFLLIAYFPVFTHGVWHNANFHV